MKRLLLFVILSTVFGLVACNVPPQTKVADSPAVLRRPDMRITPASAVFIPSGQPPQGLTNYFFSNGKKSEMWTTFGYLAPKNSNVTVDTPVVFGIGCDPTAIQYDMNWVMLDDSNNDLETHKIAAYPAVAPAAVPAASPGASPSPTPVPGAFTEENTAKYELRIHTWNMGNCERLSFKFNAFETPGFTPATDPLQISTDDNTQPNTVTAKAAYIREATRLFTINTTQATALTVLDRTILPQLEVPTCHHSATFVWQETDEHNVTVLTAFDPNKNFVTNPRKTDALLVIVDKVPGCKNEPYSFAVKAVPQAADPSAPTSAPAVTPVDPATPVVTPAPPADGSQASPSS